MASPPPSKVLCCNKDFLIQLLIVLAIKTELKPTTNRGRFQEYILCGVCETLHCIFTHFLKPACLKLNHAGYSHRR